MTATMSKLTSNKETTVANKIAGWLFNHHDFNLTYVEIIQLLVATCIKRNQTFSRDFFNALTAIIADQANQPMVTDENKIIFYNALSYLAFANPANGQRLKINNIDYRIEKIPLTSGWISAPYFAYGLVALNDHQAPAYLIFQGTTTPTDHGFLAGLLADTRPHGAIGTSLYHRGEKVIQAWVTQQSNRTKQRVICTGQSLGGAMSLHTHIYQPKRVDYYVINPPALTRREQRISENLVNVSDTFTPITNVTPTKTVVSHIKDPVFALSSKYLPAGTTMIKHGTDKENIIIAHARAPNCLNNDTIFDVNQYKNEVLAGALIWKMVKPVLFLLVVLMHIVALPVRLVIAAMNSCCLVLDEQLPLTIQPV